MPPQPLPSSSSEASQYNCEEVTAAEEWSFLGETDIIERVVKELLEVELTEKAAELYRHVGQWTKALHLFQ
ncbi:selective LIM-binding factor, putative [Eimeria praecox]|uniref:Selective LIM-binding factor, putative n=1 Tax=Eimeria praecox TaxID=51316 RepID=U6H198_9EIME|nr:selective LIM-binding factor, putative [Eimeria praecox]